MPAIEKLQTATATRYPYSRLEFALLASLTGAHDVSEAERQGWKDELAKLGPVARYRDDPKVDPLLQGEYVAPFAVHEAPRIVAQAQGAVQTNPEAGVTELADTFAADPDHPVYRQGRKAGLLDNKTRRGIMAFSLQFARSGEEEINVRQWLAGYDAAAQERATAKPAERPQHWFRRQFDCDGMRI